MTNKPLRILYLGENRGTSRQRAEAMRRVGCDVDILEPYKCLPSGRWIRRWIFKTGGLFLSWFVKHRLLKRLTGRSYDLVWVDSGELISPALVVALRDRFGQIVSYNHDDPFGPRDGWRWRLYLKAVPFYDLLVVARDCNVAEAQAGGARKVTRIFFAADEVAHAPRSLSVEDYNSWKSEVLFAGTWMPERGPFMKRLIEAGVPLSIYGDGWHKATEWPVLEPFWRGPGIFAPEDYARAIQCSKICLGLVSKGNRDLHTSRSMEIPHLGGLLMAERTEEHLALYLEDKEAVFWSNADECAEKCKWLLSDDTRRKEIAATGRIRCLANGYLNETMLKRILSDVTKKFAT